MRQIEVVILLSFSDKLRIIEMALPCKDTVRDCLVVGIEILSGGRSSCREWRLMIFVRRQILLLVHDRLSIKRLTKGRIMGRVLKLNFSSPWLIHLSKSLIQHSRSWQVRPHIVYLVICSFSIIACWHVAQCWIQLPYIHWRRLIIHRDPLMHFWLESWIHHHSILACYCLLTLNIHKLKLLHQVLHSSL